MQDATKTGIGTGIIEALAQQLGATVKRRPEGTTVSITPATFAAKNARAA